ncbi:heat shock protein 30 [Elsinoe ampelina]|uniref:Heat shock protein 30 n=1 Tax=Elsinoe ampelina TaxID=302913 RepID=A0A6A6G814_9PEZI|nr:heat shock protein 30 [Elsinoe ampelina]
MSLFPRFASGEFTPLFRLLDDYASHQLTRPTIPGSTASSTLRSFQPRFDVKESKEAYELEGELPGIDQKDVSIEFTDPQTLQIRGRTEKSYEAGTRPGIEGQEQGRITDAEKYHKPSVEEDDTTMSGANPDAKQSTEVSTETKQQEAPTHRYWVSERSVGEFSRSFNFPTRVDQEKVKASLKNGVLSILVPKAAAPVARRINIE